MACCCNTLAFVFIVTIHSCINAQVNSDTATAVYAGQVLANTTVAIIQDNSTYTLSPPIRNPNYQYCPGPLNTFLAHQVNRSLCPDWFVKSVMEPLDEVWCSGLQIWFTFFTSNKRKTGYYTFIRRDTMEVMSDPLYTCRKYPEQVRLTFLATFYQVWYGMPKVYKGDTEDAPVLFTQVVFYCIPLIVSSLLIGLYIIRKLAKENLSTHIYYYHMVIVCTCISIYVVAALQGVGFLGLILLPMCYALPAQALTYAFQGYPVECTQKFLDMMYCTCCMVQALMALDRYFALYYPVKYHVLVTKGLVLRSLAALILLNVLLGVLEFVANMYFVRGITGAIDFSSEGYPRHPVAQQLYYVDQFRIAARVLLFFVGQIAQIFACTMVFIKMRQLLKQPNAKRSKAMSQSLSTCYLLFGTCGLSFAATAIITVRLIILSDPFMGSQRLSNPSLSNVSSMSAIWTKILIPICTGLGSVIHCVSSSQFRSLLMELKPLAWLKAEVWEKYIRKGKPTQPAHRRVAPSPSNQLLTDVVSVQC